MTAPRLHVAGLDIIAAGRPDVPATMDDQTKARVAAAAPGTLFRSTDGPQGAWVWRKGVSGWTVIDGDTGHRQDASLRGGHQGVAYLRRTGCNVLLQLNITTSGNANQVILLAYGFRPSVALSSLDVWRRPPDSRISTLTLFQNGYVDINPIASGIAAAYYSTADPWPTTLPGTPA